MDIYLNFKDQSRAAIQFYEGVFHTTCNDLMTFGQMPQDDNFQVPDTIKNLVLNASLVINDTRVLFSDAPEEMGIALTMGNNVSLVIQTASTEETQTLFAKLSEDGTVTMPLAPTFWSPLYGMLEDKFGVHWQINLTA